MKPLLLILLVTTAWGNLHAQTNAETDAGVIPLRAEKYLKLYTSPEEGPVRQLTVVQPSDSIVASQYFRHKRAGYWKVYYAGGAGYLPDNGMDIEALAGKEPLGEKQQETLQSRKKRILESRDAAAARISVLYEQRRKERHLAAIEEKRLADSVAKRKTFVADSTFRENLRIENATRLAAQLAEKQQEYMDDSIALVAAEAKLAATVSQLQTKYSSYGLMISKWSWGYESEYSSASYFHVLIWNPTRKRIKYIHFSLTAEDPVGTRLRSFGKSVITVKAIGPIEPTDFGSWEFDNVFWSEVIETMTISSIKVEYMDGSVKVIAQPSKIDRSD